MNHWSDIFKQRRTVLGKKTLEFCTIQEVASTFISMLGFIPTVILIIYYAYEKSSHPQDLIPLVVLFPRVFVLLNISTALVFHFRSYYGFKGRWIYLLKKMNSPQQQNLVSRIDMNKITIDQANNSFKTPNDLLIKAREKNQRLTLRGENGAGKSTLLTWLKQEIGSDSYYLPSQNNLVFENVENNQSTGQRIKRQIAQILEKSNSKFVLLDEWDANLDAYNMAEVSRYIDEIAQLRTVIEIRHR
ncbi:MAG: ATP-binding cassette domain-containing protein [Pseudobdellovibrionaceae bacterium]